MNKSALAHNAGLMAANAARWGVNVLPVLKAVRSHPLVVKALEEAGFTRLGCAELAESRDSRDGAAPASRDDVLIALAPLRDAGTVVRRFRRSAVASIEGMQALNRAALEQGTEHEAILMLDLGDGREGVPLEDLESFLQVAASLPALRLRGVGCIFGCLGAGFPSAENWKKLAQVKNIFIQRGESNPVISVGGSICCAWLEESGAGVVTELRAGDPFLLGEDLYRQAELPGGAFRKDVCLFSGEVLELEYRNIVPGALQAGYHYVGPDDMRLPVLPGRRRRALLDLGYFHIHPCELASLVPGAVITGVSSGYTVLDITDCPADISAALRVGSRVLFRGGYWSLAKGFRSPGVKITALCDDHCNDILLGGL